MRRGHRADRRERPGAPPGELPPDSSRSRGLCLIEVLITGLVLSITSVGLAAAIVQVKRLSEAPREELLAWNAINALRSEISAAPFADAAKNYHLRGFAVAGLKPQQDDADGLPGEILYEYGPGGDTRFYKVRLRARWRGTVGARSVESSFYLANVRAETGTATPLESILQTVNGVVTTVTSTVTGVTKTLTDGGLLGGTLP
ncbi:MAG: type IV pilus modification PilV family protein [Planctomycetota bacterium]